METGLCQGDPLARAKLSARDPTVMGRIGHWLGRASCVVPSGALRAQVPSAMPSYQGFLRVPTDVCTSKQGELFAMHAFCW